MPSGGIVCSTCQRARAPTLPTCPWCRTGDGPGEDVEPPGPLGIGPDALSNLPSRIVLALLPLAWAVASWEIVALRGGRPHAYASGGAVLALGGLAMALALTGVIGVGLDRVGRRVRIDGHAPSRLAIALLVLLGLLPAVWLPLDRWLDDANAFGGDPETHAVRCTWAEARQRLDSRTGAVEHVTLHATCTPPDGAHLLVDLSLDAATEIRPGGEVVVPMWRGRWVGWLYQRGQEDPSLGIERAASDERR